MVKQLSIFDTMAEKDCIEPMGRTRAGDAETSFLAEEKVRKSGNLTKQRVAVALAVRDAPGRTSKELSWLAGIPWEVVHKRLSEVVALGQAKRGEKKICIISGAKMITWWPK